MSNPVSALSQGRSHRAYGSRRCERLRVRLHLSAMLRIERDVRTDSMEHCNRQGNFLTWSPTLAGVIALASHVLIVRSHVLDFVDSTCLYTHFFGFIHPVVEGPRMALSLLYIISVLVTLLPLSLCHPHTSKHGHPHVSKRVGPTDGTLTCKAVPIS